MIFVTVGTHHQPFDRLIRSLATLPADELVVQYGYAAPPRECLRAAPFMSFPEMLENFRDADAVITFPVRDSFTQRGAVAAPPSVCVETPPVVTRR